MEPAAVIALAVTVVLLLFAVLCAAFGIALWCFGPTRFLGPLVTCIPVAAMLGAAGGSWGLGISVARIGGPEYHGHAWWAWLIGLPAGGVLGGLLGWAMANWLRTVATQPSFVDRD
jgi:hypothetical protein